MSRGHRPVVAIGQAGRYAEAQGFTVIAGLSPAIPFDLMITRDEQIIMVRVRRLRYRNYESPSIIISCWREISGIRASTIPARISRELWVLGPDRTFHRYRVKPDCIRHIGCWEVCQHDLQETVTG